jgi:hypothetical protein
MGHTMLCIYTGTARARGEAATGQEERKARTPVKMEL